MFSLKVVAEYCLRRVLALANQLPTRAHLEEYLSLATVNDALLGTKREVIGHIISTRPGSSLA